MKIRDVRTAEKLIEYLRDFKAWESDDIYDFNLIVHLIVALLDNLKEFSLPLELEEIGYIFNDSQREFLTTFAEMANKITDEQIALEDEADTDES